MHKKIPCPIGQGIFLPFPAFGRRALKALEAYPLDDITGKVRKRGMTG
jgi:hypothetical protein